MKYLISLLVLLIVNCKKDTTAIPIEPTFDYKAYLLRNNDGVPTVKMENLEYEKANPIIQKAFPDYDFSIYNFNTEVFDFIIASELWDFKHDKIPIVRLNETQLIINVKNEILFDSSLYSLEELDEAFYLNFRSNRSKSKLISFSHDQRTDKELIVLIFNKMVNAYLKSVEEISFKKYKKPLSALNKEQLRSIKNENQIILYFPKYD